MDNTAVSSNFVCSTFLQDYAETFACNFTACSREVVSGSLSEKNLLRVGNELFSILFLQPNNSSQIQSVKSVFKTIIRSTKKAHTILSRTWLLMAKDIIDCLISRKGELNQLEMFLSRIHELSDLLTDVYFEESRLPAVQKSNVDLTSGEYREIVSIFSQYMQQNNTDDEVSELKIHTYYRSIPIELDATVRHVDDNSVAFNIHPYEAVALSEMGMAHIKSSLHLGVLKAYAKHVDIKSRTATFTHFEKLDHPEERRTSIRVEPKDVIKAKVIIDNNTITARICDISEVATAIYMRNIDSDTLVPGAAINFMAELPSLYDTKPLLINTAGTLTKIYKQPNGDADAHRIIIHLEANSGLKSKIAQYVSQRQVKIMRELKELSDDLE